MRDSTSFDLSELAGSARAWLGNLRGQLADAGAPGAKVRAALEALASALEAITAAKSQAAIIASDPSRAATYKHERAQALVGDSHASATRAALDLANAIDAARGALAKSVMPGRPSAADPMAAFTASEAAKALEGAGSSSAVVNAAAKMLADALASDDATLQWILTGGPMQLTYKRLGVNEPMLMARFADVLASADAKPANGGAALLPLLNAGGVGSLRGLVDAARYAITRDQLAYRDWLAASLRSGAMTGIYDTGLSSTGGAANR